MDDAQVKQFFQFFDSNQDGMICRDEFLALVQFVIVTAYLESADGDSLMQVAVAEEDRYSDFLKILEQDRGKLEEISAFLPEWMIDWLCSDEFLDECDRNFEALDKDGSGVLEPAELLPVVLELSQSHIDTMNTDKCKAFVRIFDVHGNGVIMRDEFVEFAQFLTVMSFLKTTVEGSDIEKSFTPEPPRPAAPDPNKRGRRGSVNTENRVNALLDMMHKGKANLPLVLPHIPDHIREIVLSKDFEKEAMSRFKSLDWNNSGDLAAVDLIPVIVELSGGNACSIDEEHCKEILSFFDSNQDGVICLDEFLALAQFCLIVAYLESQEGKQLVHSVVAGEEKFKDFISMLEKDRDRLCEIVPYLPDDLVDWLDSDEFLDGCDAQFVSLDKDKTGHLSADNLVPVVKSMCAEHSINVDSQKAKRFISVFDFHGNGVIMADEYVEFVQFMTVMSYLSNTVEGRSIDHASREIAKGPYTQHLSEAERHALMDDIAHGHRQIEDLIMRLRDGAESMAQVVPFLPQDMKDELTSDEFCVACMEGFSKMDRDGNGVLDEHEFIPLLIGMTDAHPYSLTEDLANHFIDIFDIERNGVITRKEFLRFARFMMVLAWLETDEGQRCLQAWEGDMGSTGYGFGASASAEATHVNHLSVDVDHFKTKADRLESDNEALRSRMQSLEASMRKMEAKIQDQEVSRRHLEVELKAVGSPSGAKSPMR
eukprot:gnl/TRDRNA2_/TRDRNA2_147274_c0_seq1.p1 gnl/TRDRNA2_/TRDRNA2_147274_c0~~gnl/TRDRNA2_/TRDRNA2_147274_c0_seq1.p1  ORF type:complete len:736 (+),score=136.44 gnl/TRDRNA2_/TRDRNA2_147274_c0_seq1:79-2208(+)